MQDRGRDTARLFLALWPDAEVRARLARHADAWGWPRTVARVRDDKLHLTLHFLGEVERERVAELRQLRQPFAPFTLRFGQAELWPHGLAVLRPHDVPAALRRLHADLGATLRAQGLPVDTREFRPHVTLARRAARAVPPAAPPDLAWRIERFALVESTAQQAYTVLGQYVSSHHVSRQLNRVPP